jgi:hypothetical protein
MDTDHCNIIKPVMFFGYLIKLPNHCNFIHYIDALYELNNIIKEPFRFVSLLPIFHTNIEYNIKTHEEYLEIAHVIFGFKPHNDIHTTLDLSKSLSEYIHQNPLLDGIHIINPMQFFCGIEWTPHLELSSDYESICSTSDTDT